MLNLQIQKNGHTKFVSNYAWDLMGKEKSGWTVIEDAPASVTAIATPAPPPTGDNANVKNQAVSEIALEQKIEDVSQAQPEAELGEAPNPASEQEPGTPEFNEFADANLTVGNIKDYLDVEGIKYAQSDKKEVLISILGTAIGNDIEKLKKEFSIV